MRGLTWLAIVFIAYALIASRLDRWWITAPTVFVAAGALLDRRAPRSFPRR